MRAAALVLCALLSGCTLLDQELPPPPTSLPTPTGATTPTQAQEPTIVFHGKVRSAVTGEPLAGVAGIVELTQVAPCLQPRLVWRDYPVEVAPDGAFSREVPRPRSDDFAFFLRFQAPGHTENSTPIGPTSRRDIALDVVLHPVANVSGTAPPGTLVALAWPGFPRVALAGADGRFAFEGTRSLPSAFVAGTDEPWSTLAAPNATLEVPAPTQRGWTLEGSVKGPTGAGLASDVVAFNGTRLVGVARSGASGAFAIHLPREIGRVDLVARTEDGHYGAAKTVDIAGPPALTETLLAKARC